MTTKKASVASMLLTGAFLVSAPLTYAAENKILREYEDQTVTGVNREEGRSTFWYRVPLFLFAT